MACIVRVEEASLAPYLILSGIAMIEVMFGVKTNSGSYVWTTLAWLGWYSYVYEKIPDGFGLWS
jgi:hypothetical protein